ncbi:ATP-binding protein [Sphingobium yanoikuyae]|uniref:hypothetical protein n=1 Tax=Sphingobium yanoikuyae TaxID=13690 RepID=UPI00293C594F|nr:hypothetical protein [Sphingobium yanoikuyae]MDV3481144.1 hypothetical protein [Sphingobium yanoikuyae]
MPALTPNIENRVRKLPKPSNHTQGLQPLFEAVSNAFYAIEDRFDPDVSDTGRAEVTAKGCVDIVVEQLSKSEKVTITVSDNGIGLDDRRYEAFGTIDTDFKRAKGGKGVGRLFWLDAFETIEVESRYIKSDGMAARAFAFMLNNDEQIVPKDSAAANGGCGTSISFKGLRTKDYADHFPKRADTFLRYFSAHFIADFLLGAGPRVTVTLDGETTQYPKEISELVVGPPLETGAVPHPKFGDLSVVGFTCRPEASTGLDGNHQLHLLANGRTVETRKIDNLLGLESIEREGEEGLVFHGCVSGAFLDDRVNEGRTAFNLPESILKEISRQCVEMVKERLLPDQIGKYRNERRESYDLFVHRHPIYDFDDPEVQLDRVPFHAKAAEDFAAGLVKFQIRREEGRQNAMQTIIDALDGEDIPENFDEAISRVARDIQASEKLALAQHVVRRKLVLELLEKLLRRIRKMETGNDQHHLESTLHSFICPMSIMGDDHQEVKSRAHDLWIVDERFAFTRAFSSDKRLDKILAEGGSAHRPDLMIWDFAVGMGVTDPEKNAEHIDMSEPLTKVMIVEFKQPGRKNYAKAEDQIEQQIIKYLAQLKGGQIETFQKERVRIANDCVFHCYVVADIVGDLELQLSGWETTANGQGRIRPLKNEYRGSIEVIQWQDLVNDAWQRNKAMLYAAGLSRAVPTK